jgi:hypothetical protein
MALRRFRESDRPVARPVSPRVMNANSRPLCAIPPRSRFPTYAVVRGPREPRKRSASRSLAVTKSSRNITGTRFGLQAIDDLPRVPATYDDRLQTELGREVERDDESDPGVSASSATGTRFQTWPSSSRQASEGGRFPTRPFASNAAHCRFSQAASSIVCRLCATIPMSATGYSARGPVRTSRAEQQKHAGSLRGTMPLQTDQRAGAGEVAAIGNREMSREADLARTATRFFRRASARGLHRELRASGLCDCRAWSRSANRPQCSPPRAARPPIAVAAGS